MMNMVFVYIMTHDILTPYDNLAEARRQRLIALEEAGYADKEKLENFISYDAAYGRHLNDMQQNRKWETAAVLKRVRTFETREQKPH